MVTPLADSVASQGRQGEHWGVLTGFGIKAAFELFEVADAALVQVNGHAFFGQATGDYAAFPHREKTPGMDAPVEFELGADEVAI